MYSVKDWGSIGIQIDSSFILTLTLIVVKKAWVLGLISSHLNKSPNVIIKLEPVVK